MVRVLHLVLWSHGDVYASFRKATEPLYATYASKVDTLYYIHDNASKKVQEVNNTLLIPGSETYDSKTCLGGLQTKLLESLQYKWDHGKYDFVVRSNASTVVNFDTLLDWLEKHKQRCVYAGTHIMESTDHPAEYDVKSFQYCQGTCFILAPLAVNLLLRNVESIPMDIEDDRALGLFFLENGIKPISIDNQFVGWKSEYNLDQVVAFRNHHFHTDRREDILNAQRACHALRSTWALLPESEVIRAFYHHRDVTELLKGLCHNRPTFDTNGENSQLDSVFGDPRPGQFKVLSVVTKDTVLSIRTKLSFWLLEDGKLVVRFS